MIYPVVIYGAPVLRKVAQDIPKDMEGLDEFVTNMWETMYVSDGVGLAAPQVGRSLRLFVIDGNPMSEDDSNVEGFKQTFINAKIVERKGDDVLMGEGCLSIPGIREEVNRPGEIRIEYYDENWEFHDEWYSGIAARIIQHEYDHLEGILFTDHLAPLRKRLLKGKLAGIAKGKFKVDYKYKLAK